MKESALRSDVQELVERSVTAEAEDRVWSTMDRAMNRLDTESRVLLTDYFNGKTVAQLSLKHGLNPREIEDWLNHTKRILMQELRTECAVRQ